MGWAKPLSSLVVAIALAGCPSTAPGPRATAQRYLEALEERRVEDAWRFLAPETRATTDRRAVAERLEQGALSPRLATDGRWTVLWETEDTGSVARGPLELELAAQWRVTRVPPRLDRPQTPDAALEAFRRGIDDDDVSLLWALAPTAERQGLDTARLRAALQEPGFREDVSAALGRLLAEGAGRAEAGVGWVVEAGPHRARLVLEGGYWRLSDVR